MDPRTKKIVDTLKNLGACSPALDWVESKRFVTVREAWKACRDPDWLTWVVYVLCTPDAGQEVYEHLLDRARELKTLRARCDAVRQMVPVPTLADLLRVVYLDPFAPGYESKLPWVHVGNREQRGESVE